MVLVEASSDPAVDEPDQHSTISFKISQFEISNELFCEFLNVDAISSNDLLVNNIINLNGNHCKIIEIKGI